MYVCSLPAVHTVAHWYNYERFVAFSPPAPFSDFGVDDDAFIPQESTVVVSGNTVSIITISYEESEVLHEGHVGMVKVTMITVIILPCLQKVQKFPELAPLHLWISDHCVGCRLF